MMALQQYYLSLSKWYAALQPREKTLVGILGVLLLAVSIWLMILRPVEQAKHSSAQHYLAAQSDLQWMQAHAKEAGAILADASSRHIPPGSPLIAVVTEAAKQQQVTIGHANPAQDGSLRLSLDNVAFADLMLWLQNMHDAYGIEAKEITVTRLPKTPGYVRAGMTLRTQ